DESRDLKTTRFDILSGDAIVADFRTRHRDDLSGIRRIGQYFLVAGHARVEHDFAGGFSWGAGRFAAIPDSIFEREHSFHQSLFRSSNVAVTRACSLAFSATFVEKERCPVRSSCTV